ncbi:MAG: hypothetical protein N2595_08475 [bacterium]|nr:hypothetical protein [bacterium]
MRTKSLVMLCAVAGVLAGQFAWAAPTMTDVIIPQHIQGVNGTNNRRVPYAFRVKFSGLTPNATYRYINQVVFAWEASTIGGAGNVIFVNTAGNFYGSSSPTFTASGGYGEFTTDSSGEAEVWMITEPTGNTLRFVPGSSVWVRVRINNGAGGASAANYFTSPNPILVQDLTTTSSGYTAIRGTATGNPKDFVFLYDNEAGTGRPLSGTLMESDGYTAGTLYAAFYRNDVDGQNNNWGSVTPNNNASGVRRVERRSLLTGAVVAYNTDADGVWPSGADTINPLGGPTAIVLTSGDAPLPEPAVAAIAAIAGVCLLRKRG